MGQPDVAAEAHAPRLAGAAVRGLHDSRTAAGHDGVARRRQGCAELSREPVVGMAFGEARGAEHGDAGPVEIEALEATQELEKVAHRALEIRLAIAAPGKERLLGALDLAEQGEGPTGRRFRRIRHVRIPPEGSDRPQLGRKPTALASRPGNPARLKPAAM